MDLSGSPRRVSFLFAHTPKGSVVIYTDVLLRLANVQAELTALAAALARDLPSSAEGLQAATDAPAPPRTASPTSAPDRQPAATEVRVRKVRWSYQPGTAYRIVGGNPFREGNNYNLFASLAERFGSRPFLREELGEQITALRGAGVIDSVMNDEAVVIGFLQFAGAQKGRIVMVGHQGADGESDEGLPPDAGE